MKRLSFMIWDHAFRVRIPALRQEAQLLSGIRTDSRFTSSAELVGNLVPRIFQVATRKNSREKFPALRQSFQNLISGCSITVVFTIRVREIRIRFPASRQFGRPKCPNWQFLPWRQRLKIPQNQFDLTILFCLASHYMKC